jgi:hypothetical protein
LATAASTGINVNKAPGKKRDMRTSWRLWTSLFVSLAAAGAAGCSGGQPTGSWKNTAVGTVQVALTGTAPSGASYRLDNAVFEISNFSVFPPTDIVVSGDDPTLNIDLPPSNFPFDYQIFLHDGWTLNAVNADGSEIPLGATLLNNFIPFTIKSGRTTPITFQFKASEVVITTGNGTASVRVSVDDTLIDDFEDGDGLIAPLGGRNGAWFTFNDGTGTQTPAPGTPVVPVVVDTSANFLLDMTGSGFAPQGPLPSGGFAFGAGVGASLLFDPVANKPLPYDASKYTGIDFTFQTNSGSMNFPMQVSFFVATSATTPVDQGGTCTGVCNDDFGFVGFVPPGQFFFSGGFTWDQLTQQGFGDPATFDPATIINIKWIVAFPNFGQPPSDNSFDFRLDDVTFTASPFSTGVGGTTGTGGVIGTGRGGSAGGGIADGGAGGDPRPPGTTGAGGAAGTATPLPLF